MTKRTVPVTDAEFVVVSQFRIALHRHQSALSWIKGDIERIERNVADGNLPVYYGEGLPAQASKLAQAESEMSSLLEIAKVLFADRMGDFRDLVNDEARADFFPEKNTGVSTSEGRNAT